MGRPKASPFLNIIRQMNIENTRVKLWMRINYMTIDDMFIKRHMSL